jgi:hypothetical protein
VVVNFLHANSGNYSVIVSITISRKFVSMGRKSCLFVCYEKQIGTELWMVEGVTTLNGGLHSRTVEGKIRRTIKEQCKQVLVFLLSISFRR